MLLSDRNAELQTPNGPTLSELDERSWVHYVSWSSLLGALDRWARRRRVRGNTCPDRKLPEDAAGVHGSGVSTKIIRC